MPGEFEKLLGHSLGDQTRSRQYNLERQGHSELGAMGKASPYLSSPSKFDLLASAHPVNSFPGFAKPVDKPKVEPKKQDG